MTQKLKILLVEDSKIIHKHLTQMLHDIKGVEMIGSSSSVSQGQKMMNKQAADVVILDIQLKDSNGMELLKWVKTEYPQTCVIIFSNNADTCHRAFAKINGADYFFDKSMEFEKMARTLSKINKTNSSINTNQKTKQ